VPIGTMLELDGTIGQSEQGMVAANPNVTTWMIASTSLTNDNITRNSLLTTKELDTQSLRFRFTTVFGTTYTFLVSHCTNYLLTDL
jgi:hypothetical protein